MPTPARQPGVKRSECGGAVVRMGKADLAPRDFSTGRTHDTCFLLALRLVWVPVGAREGRWRL